MEKQTLQISTDIGAEIIIRIKELLSQLDEIIRIKNEEKFKDSLLDRNRA